MVRQNKEENGQARTYERKCYRLGCDRDTEKNNIIMFQLGGGQ